MSSNIFYTGIKKSKTGKDVPVLANGRTFFSEYNPERDIQFYAAAPSVKYSGFILVGGLGDGSHIRALHDANPTALLMVLERNRETIDYLFSESICNAEIKANPSILFTTPETLGTDLKNAYIPVLHGTFLYHPIKAWQLAYEQLAYQACGGGSSLKDAIQDTLHDIAADYSTQARFGKLMHTNVLKNLRLLSNSVKKGLVLNSSDIIQLAAKYKEAAVIGAGPSLDDSIKVLKENPGRFFIISTDTAYRTLYRNGINPNIIVTLDGQISSIAHFIGIDSPETIVAADICANAAAARHLMGKGHKLFFFTTGHPLGTLVNSWYKNNCKFGANDISHQKTDATVTMPCTLQTETCAPLLPYLDAGFGTVLSAAADLAVKSGFRSILFFGADFAYKSGKPYTQGTYLDEIYSINANRLSSSEIAFCSLCYRTELTKLKDAMYTTPLLASYKRHMESFINSRPSSFKFISSSSLTNDDTQQISCFKHEEIKYSSQALSFDYDSFLSFFLEHLKNKDNSLLYTILPFATWIKEKEKNADIKNIMDIFEKAAQITALH